MSYRHIDSTHVSFPRLRLDCDPGRHGPRVASHEFRLRHDAEARRCLNEARRWIASRETAATDLSDMQPPWSDWDEPVVNALLLREAEEVLGQQSAVSNQN